MKKLFLTVLVIASAITYTTAQTTKTDAAHWSFALKGGVDYFNISPAGEDFYNNASWGAGIGAEYTINPLVGVGLNLDLLNFNRNTIQGQTIDPSLFTSVNLSNLLNPNRKAAKLNFYANVGLGASFANYSGLVLPATAYPRRIATKGDVTSGLAYTGLAMEWNVSKPIAIGLEGTYRGYVTPKTNYVNYNDALAVVATVRLKFGTGKKTHVRDMTASAYYPTQVTSKVEDNPYDDSAIIRRLDALDRANTNIQNQLNDLEAAVKSLEDSPKGTSTNVSFDNIEFDFNSAKINKDSYVILDQVVSVLKNNPTWKTVLIQGHTDAIGSDVYNQKLSEKRAQSVKVYLESKGISSSAISTVGYGSSRPIAPNVTANDNDNPKGRQFNRRVEFEISN